MWIVCGVISVIFCVMAWIMTMNKNKNAVFASMFSLSFVAITLLMEYKMVVNWVDKEDWSAMLDVVPSMFPVLCGYVILLLLANGVVIVKNKNTRRTLL